MRKNFPNIDGLCNIVQGFETNFDITCVNGSGLLYCPVKNKFYTPSEVSIYQVCRLDSPYSDPDDNLIVYLLQTAHAVKGYIIDSYSIYADHIKQVFLENVKAVGY